VISNFLEELWLFIGENRFLREKKIPSLCQMKILSTWFLKDAFKLETSPFGLLGIGLAGLSFDFWPQKQIPSGSSHTNFWLLFRFHVKYWPILLFLGLIWCKVLCWAQKSTLHGVQSKAFQAQKRNLLVLKFL
jgi:hypothetical protein